MDTLTSTTVQPKELRTRGYQDEMFEQSMQGNVIIAMDTGSGKTAVAVLRIIAELDRCPAEKRIWFLAPTVELCKQQQSYIRSYVPAVATRLLIGSDNVDRWSEQQIWDDALDKIKIVVSTPAVLGDAMSHGFVNISSLALVIFDEAHHCYGKHYYNRIMQDFYFKVKAQSGPQSVPHLIGLTASPVLRSKIEELQTIESNLDATTITPRRNRLELLKYVHHPEVQRLDYSPCKPGSYTSSSKTLSSLTQLLASVEVEQNFSRLSINPIAAGPLDIQTQKSLPKAAWVVQLEKFHRKATTVYEELGGWAADYFILQTIDVLKHQMNTSERFVGLKDSVRLPLLQILDKKDFTGPAKPLSSQSHLSSKLEELIKFLELQNPEECSGLIFVQQRVTVSVLHTVLSNDIRTAGRYQCATFVGTSDSAKKKYNLSELFDVKAQQNTMTEFRARLKNLVIATDVLEEGIDVAACNLVVCFDPPKNLKSFIQRRGRARKERSKYVMMLPLDDDSSRILYLQKLESQLLQTIQDEARIREEAMSKENEEEEVLFRLEVESTGAVLTADSTLAHIHHFCQTLPHQRYVDMRPEFSFTENDMGKITATVTLPSCVNASVRCVKGSQAWDSVKAATKDAAFQCYASLFRAGLLNDNLLPLTRDWQDDEVHAEMLPATIEVDIQTYPLIRMAKAWTAPNVHQTRVMFRDGAQTAEELLSMTLTTPVKIIKIPPITLHWDTETTFTVSLEDAASRTSFSTASLNTLRKITQVLHQSTRSDQNMKGETDFVMLFGPDVEEDELPKWLTANCGRMNALDVFRTGQKNVNGFVRSHLLYGYPHILYNWHVYDDSELPNALEIECFPLRKGRNFEAQNKSSNLAASSATRTVHLSAKECTIDNLGLNYAMFSLFIPSIVQHIEVYTVADELQRTLLSDVGIKDIQHIVNAIIAPSANWITDYQRYEFIGDAVLKFAASVQLYADHSNWPEGYLSKRRDRFVCNQNLANAALKKGLQRYILTEQQEKRKWRPPRISDPDRSDEKRELSMKVLADVTEALIGAAFLDSGLKAARSCINFFISQICAKEPTIASPWVKTETCNELVDVESLIGYKFKNKALLLEALTHPSYGVDNTRESYQRLEFLGDAVLDMLIVTRLSQCETALSQGQMTRLKAALTNAGLLGFVCMDHDFVRSRSDIEENRPGEFTRVSISEALQLWRFMKHYSEDIIEAQKVCNERYMQYSAAIHRCLNDGSSYPWAWLARLSPEKFYSDIIESMIGAIFVDSQGSLSECQQFIDRIGLGGYVHRMTTQPFDVVHPRDSLQQLAGSAPVEFTFEQDHQNHGLFCCQVSVDGKKIVEVKDCLSKDEAIVVGADASLSILSTQIAM